MDELERDPLPPIGQATPGQGDAETADDPASPRLYIPDPESPRGWRTHQVQRRSPRPRVRPLGFPRGRRVR